MLHLNLALSALLFAQAAPPLSPQAAWGLEVAETRSNSRDGARITVTYLNPGGLAQRAGLKRGDMLVKIGGREITDEASLNAALKAALSFRGDEASLTCEVKRAETREDGRPAVAQPRRWTVTLRKSKANEGKVYVSKPASR